MNLGTIGFWLCMVCLAFYALFTIAAISHTSAMIIGVITVGFLIWGAYEEY